MFLPQTIAAGLDETTYSASAVSARLQLLSCRIERAPVATSRVTVECAAPGVAQHIRCVHQGSACPGGDLRLAALATMDAVMQATGGELKLELIGVKPLRAFDTNVVVVAALAHHDGVTTRIVGTALSDDDLLLGTAQATLAAVNRLAGPLLRRATDA